MSGFRAVVFDWAGTVVDCGCFAPVQAFVEAFAAEGVTVSESDARAPMGLPKRAHIAVMMQAPHIALQWRERHGAPPDAAAITRLHDRFEPLSITAAEHFAAPVPGAVAAIAALRDMGLKIGSTTGYSRAIMARLAPAAAAHGYRPDNIVAADDLPEGRPGPLGMYRCFIDLVAHPPASVVKVDDTEPGIAEGKSAGCVTVGVMLSGNHAGLSASALAALDEAGRDAIRRRAGHKLRDAGADHLIDTVAELPDLLQSLSAAPPAS